MATYFIVIISQMKKLRYRKSKCPSKLPQLRRAVGRRDKDSIQHRSRAWRTHVLKCYTILWSQIVCVCSSDPVSILVHMALCPAQWAASPAPLPLASGWVWPIESTSRKLEGRGCIKAVLVSLLAPSVPRPRVPQREASGPIEKPSPVAPAKPTIIP